MEKAAIFHRAVDNYIKAVDSKTVHIRIQTKKSDVTSIQLLAGDPYIWLDDHWQYTETSMSLTGSDHLLDYWDVYIKLPHKRLRYGFKISSGDETQVLTEKGFFDEAPSNSGYYFSLPYLHQTEYFQAPEWVKDTVWYQIFPERFANGNPSLDPEGTKPWASTEPTPTNFFGGDFEGVINHLDYLEDLGITGIYFTPIFKAYSNHKYDTIDYLAIDPQFGDEKTLKRLVSECHKRGIKVMLDAVFNHSGYYFPPFQDVLKHGADSSYKDWFHPHAFPLKGGDRPNYETFGFVDTMPKLNTYHPEVMKYLLNVASYWINEFDIDGWRLDVANEVDHQFWREFRQTVRSIKPDIYILGEIWHDSMAWLRGDQFDAVMNYPFTTNVLNLLANQTINANQFTNNIIKAYYSYPKSVFDVTFNLVGSHDTPRILTECNGDVDRAKLIFTILLTFMGTPCIYYGDEIGIDGEHDPGCRKCMIWNEAEQNRDLHHYIKKLIALRKQERLLANEGQVEFIHTDQEIVAFRKYNTTHSVVVLINPTATNQHFVLPFELNGLTITNLLTGSSERADSQPYSVGLERYGAAILFY